MAITFPFSNMFEKFAKRASKLVTASDGFDFGIKLASAAVMIVSASSAFVWMLGLLFYGAISTNVLVVTMTVLAALYAQLWYLVSGGKFETVIHYEMMEDGRKKRVEKLPWVERHTIDGIVTEFYADGTKRRVTQ